MIDSTHADGSLEQIVPAAEEEQSGRMLPVLERPAPPGRTRRLRRALIGDRTAPAAALPAVQAAAVAAGGFVAGAAVLGLVNRRQRGVGAVGRAAAKNGALARAGDRRGAAERVQILGSRTLLVDVHMLGIPELDR